MTSPACIAICLQGTKLLLKNDCKIKTHPTKDSLKVHTPTNIFHEPACLTHPPFDNFSQAINISIGTYN